MDIYMKTTKILFWACALLFTLQACDLDRDPANYIDYEKSYRNMQDAKKWDNGIYSTLRGKFGGAYVIPQEAQADMLNAHAAFGNLYGEFHGWTIKPESAVLQELYHSYYAALIDANVVLKLLPKMEVSSDEQVQRNHFLGDAYFARAFYHFNLALRWGMIYDKNTADKDLGVVLATEPGSIDKPKRATNADTYKLILADLGKADSLLKDVPVKPGNTEINADAVKALRARVYLYMGDMAKAYNEAKQLIDHGTYPLIEPYYGRLDANNRVDAREDAFAQMWFYDDGKEQIWQPFVDKENEIATTTGFYGADLSTATYWDNQHDASKIGDYNKPAYVPTREVINDLFSGENDHRAQVLFEFVHTTVNDMNASTQLYVISKFKGNPNYATLNSTHWGGYVPNGNQAPKPFRIAEQYLIVAEAAYDLGNINDAQNYLNQLRRSRGLDPTDLTGDALYQEIKNERARELAYEGFRLWDLRRWKQGVKKRTFQGRENYYMVPSAFYAGGYKVDIQPDNYMFVWPLPMNETLINTNLLPNPGWGDK